MAEQYSRNVSLTSDLSTIAFGFRPNFIRIDASTAGTAYLSFNSTQIATTASSTDSNSFQLTSGNAAPLVFSNPVSNGLTSKLTAIAATGSTAVVRVLAVRI